MNAGASFSDGDSEMTDGHGPRWFSTTHWSVVVNAHGETPEAREALETLCQAYWPPLYAFIRRSGCSPEEACDLTQGFFLDLLRARLVSRADRERGRFRSFLLGALKHFLAHEREKAGRLKRGGDREIISLDAVAAEKGYLIEPADTATPETLFERRWALAVIEKALAVVRQDYDESARKNLFEALKDYVWGERSSEGYAGVASRLGMSEEAVKKAVQRLRVRLRECVRMEIAQTVAVAGDVDAEMTHLLAVLRGR